MTTFASLQKSLRPPVLPPSSQPIRDLFADANLREHCRRPWAQNSRSPVKSVPPGDTARDRSFREKLNPPQRWVVPPVLARRNWCRCDAICTKFTGLQAPATLMFPRPSRSPFTRVVASPTLKHAIESLPIAARPQVLSKKGTLLDSACAASKIAPAVLTKVPPILSRVPPRSALDPSDALRRWFHDRL